MSTKLTQHEIRQHALQALFTLEVRKEGVIEKVISYTFDDKIVDSPNYLENLVTGVLEKQEDLDVQISRHLTSDWSISRLTKVDKIILRLAVYEILETDTPNIVAIDEALNLAHDFSDTAAVKLINGILTNLMKK